MGEARRRKHLGITPEPRQVRAKLVRKNRSIEEDARNT
jgi:hypothetical protein